MFQWVHVFVQRCCRSCFWSIIDDHYIIWQKKMLNKTSRLWQFPQMCPRKTLSRILSHSPVHVGEQKRGAAHWLASPVSKFEDRSLCGRGLWNGFPPVPMMRMMRRVWILGYYSLQHHRASASSSVPSYPHWLRALLHHAPSSNANTFSFSQH